jgi:hypothetical protein
VGNLRYYVTRNFMIYSVIYYCYGNEMKEVMMELNMQIHCRKEINTEFSWGNLQASTHLEDREEYGRVTLKWIFGR